MSEADPDMQHGTKEFPVGGEIDGPGKQYFDNVVLDNMMDAFLELSAAVWTYHDRTIILETVLSDLLKQQGTDVDLPALIEAYQPTPEVKEKRKAERAEYVSTVFASFSRRAK